jgi:HPt (histidine-containing phosphotransfer) domain-containing protein
VPFNQLRNVMSPAPIISPSALADMRELNPDDPAFLREMIDLFIHDVGERVAELDRALATADANLLLRAAHTIKGSCCHFGAAELMRVSQIIEAQGKASDFSGAVATVPALKAAYAAVSEELKNFR